MCAVLFDLFDRHPTCPAKPAAMFWTVSNFGVRSVSVPLSHGCPASVPVHHIHRQKIRKERNEDEWHDRTEYTGWRIPAD